MGLMDLLTSQPGPNRMRCETCKVIEVLDESDGQALADAFANTDFTAPMISRALAAIGHDVSPVSVQRHRRGACRSLQ